MEEVEVKNLQPLLRSVLGDVIVESYTVRNLLPPGENYGSKIYSIHAVIKRSSEQNSEDLHLVAKVPPATEFQREIFNSKCTFPKEIFMYSDILPFYRQVETESGVTEGDLLEISPKYFGSRLSQSPDGGFDDDAVLLLENLQPRGYYCTERRTGCDLVHARYAIKAVAQFHALGMAVKEKHPEFFDVMRTHGRSVLLDANDALSEIIRHRLNDVADDPVASEFYDVCAAAVASDDVFAGSDVSEPWSTIVHTDFWSNNMLFHRKNGEGEPDDVKLIDFQNYLLQSPMRELVFFLSVGLDADTVAKCDELIDLYYNSLIGKLVQLNCSVEPYSRESFDAQLRKDAYLEFGHCLCMVKVLTMDVKNVDSDIKFLLTNADGGEWYKNRLRHFINLYRSRGWFSQ